MLYALFVFACLAVAIGMNPLGWVFAALRSPLFWEFAAYLAILSVAVMGLLTYLREAAATTPP